MLADTDAQPNSISVATERLMLPTGYPTTEWQPVRRIHTMLADTDAQANGTQRAGQVWIHNACNFCLLIVLTFSTSSYDVGRHGCAPEFDQRATEFFASAGDPGTVGSLNAPFRGKANVIV